MKPFEMDGVDAVLHDLKPVAGHQGTADVPEATGPREDVVARQERRGFGPEVGPDEASELLGPIRPCAHSLAKDLTLLQRGQLDARATSVEAPAVIRATDRAIVDDPVGERCAA